MAAVCGERLFLAALGDSSFSVWGCFSYADEHKVYPLEKTPSASPNEKILESTQRRQKGHRLRAGRTKPYKERRVQGRAEEKEEACVSRGLLLRGAAWPAPFKNAGAQSAQAVTLLAAFGEFSDFFVWQGSECFSKRLDLKVRREGKTFANAARRKKMNSQTPPKKSFMHNTVRRISFGSPGVIQ